MLLSLSMSAGTLCVRAARVQVRPAPGQRARGPFSGELATAHARGGRGLGTLEQLQEIAGLGFETAQRLTAHYSSLEDNSYGPPGGALYKKNTRSSSKNACTSHC